MLIDKEPAFRLERISGNTFAISGVPPGITLEFREGNHVTREVVLNLKGLPKDLYSARLGKFQGPSIDERQVTLPVIAAEPVGAPGVL